MTTKLVVALVLKLCPNLEAESPQYVLQGYKVNCMEYYANDIYNRPSKYTELLNKVSKELTSVK